MNDQQHHRRWSVLLLFSIGVAASVDAQVISSTALGIPGAEVQRMVRLDDGTTLTVGRLNDALHLVNWSPEGDTLWTRSLPASDWFYGVRTLLPLSNGQLLLSGYWEAWMLDEQLESLGPVDLNGSHVIEYGQDSLLVAELDSLFLKRPDGEVIWRRHITQWEIYHSTYDSHLLAPRDGGFLLYSMYESPVTEYSYGSLANLGRYAHDGTFVDTVRLINAAESIVGNLSTIGTADGGALSVGVYNSSSPLFLRTDAMGSIQWTHHIPFESVWVDGFPGGFIPHNMIELPEGGFIMCGHAYSESFARLFGLMEFDPLGNPLCWRQLAEAEYALGSYAKFQSALEKVGDLIHVYYTSQTAGLPSQVHRAVVGDVCSTLGIASGGVPITSTPRFTFRQGFIQAELPPENGPTKLELFDMKGRLLNEHTTSLSPLRIPTSGLVQGTYIIRATDQSGTRCVVEKVVLF